MPEPASEVSRKLTHAAGEQEWAKGVGQGKGAAQQPYREQPPQA